MCIRSQDGIKLMRPAPLMYIEDTCEVGKEMHRKMYRQHMINMWCDVLKIGCLICFAVASLCVQNAFSLSVC